MNEVRAGSYLRSSLTRKIVPNLREEKLSKGLNMCDVTFIGVGATIGVGSFIFIGTYSVTIGPAFILSNIFTAGVILMSAMCYAEFIRCHNSCGGAYSAAYKTVGEIRAVLLGSLLCMEHVVASALAARALSKLIDELFSKFFSRNIKSYMSFTSPFLYTHPDVIGCVISLAALGMVSFDVKKVSIINNYCCFTNLGLFVLITLVSGSNLNFDNWNLPPSEACGNGGFMPYGLGSVFRGMSKVYISYLGLDGIANAGSEVRDPQRIIPLSMIVAVIIVTVLFTLNSFTYTLVWSYCDQYIDDPIPEIMAKIGLDIMKWITSLGLPITMLGNFICNTYPLSRLVYAMAEDGMLCKFLSQVDDKTKTPLRALYTSGVFVASFVLFSSTVHLSELSCLAAILSYSIISYMVIYLSYRDDHMEFGESDRTIMEIIFNRGEKRTKRSPTVLSSSVVRICCWFMCGTIFPFYLILKLGHEEALGGDLLAILAYITFIVVYGTVFYIIKCQPLSLHAQAKGSIMPILPILVILINGFLCLEYDIYTWMHCFIWLTVAAFIYFSYGIWNSKAKNHSMFIG